MSAIRYTLPPAVDPVLAFERLTFSWVNQARAAQGDSFELHLQVEGPLVKIRQLGELPGDPDIRTGGATSNNPDYYPQAFINFQRTLGFSGDGNEPGQRSFTVDNRDGGESIKVSATRQEDGSLVLREAKQK